MEEEPGEGGPLRSSFRESTDSLASMTISMVMRLRNSTSVFGLELIPWDAVVYLHPSVVRVHMQPHGLVEVKKGMLGCVAWSVHGLLLHSAIGFGVKLQGKSMPGNRTPAIILL